MSEDTARLEVGDIIVLLDDEKITIKKNGLAISVTHKELEELSKQLGIISEALRSENEEMFTRLFGER